MLSAGEIIDKLIIENIKIAMLKEQINTKSIKKDDLEYVRVYEKMMDLNTNRAIIAKELDSKLERIFKGEKNSVLKVIKTYG